MTDSIAVCPPGWRALDANGAVISGAKLKFYDAGTSTPKTVYSDSTLSTSLGATVTCDSGGYPVSGGSTKTIVYTGTAAYKLVITDADDVTIATHDNLRGATASAAASTGQTDLGIVVADSTYSVAGDGVTDDRTALQAAIDATPTGGILWIPATDDFYRVNSQTSNVCLTVDRAMEIIIAGVIKSTIDGTVTAHQLMKITADDVTIRCLGSGALQGSGVFNPTTAPVGLPENDFSSLLRIVGTSYSDRLTGISLHDLKFVDPCDVSLWATYCEGLEVINIDHVGGPLTSAVSNVTTQIVSGCVIDVCYNTSFRGGQFRPNAAGGVVVLGIQGTSIAAGSGERILVEGVNFEYLQDKAVYTHYDRVTFIGCKVAGNPSIQRGNGIRVGTRAVIIGNTMSDVYYGGIALSNGSHSVVKGNVLTEIGNNGIAVYYDYGTEAAIEHCVIDSNTIEFSATADNTYSGVAITPTAIDTAGIVITNNVIHGAGQRSGGSVATDRYAINMSNQTGSGSGILHVGAKIEGNKIEACGRHAIWADGLQGCSIVGNEVVDAGQNATTDNAGIYLYGTYNKNNRIERNTFRDSRSGGSRLMKWAIYDSGSTWTGGTVRENICDNLTGVPCYSISSGSNCTFEGNSSDVTAALHGTFTMAAAATKDITCPHIHTVAKFSVILIPTNAAAVTLQTSSKCLIFNSAGSVVGTSFRVATADGASAAGTETFAYRIVI